MYAVISDGGKQYRVAKDDVVCLETTVAESGDTLRFENVLLVADGDNIQVGMPYLKGAVVSAKVLGFGRADKIEIVKFKRRKHHMKRMGHRQNYIEVKITDIEV